MEDAYGKVWLIGIIEGSSAASYDDGEIAI